MGGRGTFASGNSVAYTYETVDKIEGVKVLQGLNGKHNLPEESHSSKAYILTDKNGNFIRYREFKQDHTSKFDIDYHPEKKYPVIIIRYCISMNIKTGLVLR